ncbi:MAG: PEP-CTERM sorting domain-containing protein [Aquabacterium sp.]|uniref:PEP-CTERM sorting domain-containing protein n=1 Tax=Aquabacterium sp. TaxID=1872578 RepID=UPI00271712BB|nr:PEP-CTERM sorting domain-containing protein [Aquabacterium sp.]MDO9006551.1 PEP-CTERM sorting domain-containing protein [Aquabacterium sp.]
MKRSFALCAVFLACCGAASADVTDVANASTSFSGLNYTLVDLDLSDGITPWIQFNHNHVLQGFNQNYSNIQFNSQAGSIFTAPAGSITADGLQASSTSGANTTSSQLKAENIQDLQYGGSPDTQIGYQGAVVMTTYGTGVDGDMNIPVPLPGEFSWTLSPHTRLIIQGTAQAAASVDLSKLTQGPLFQDVSNNLYGVRLLSSSVLTAQLMANAFVSPDTGDIVPDQFDELQLLVEVEQSLSSNGLSVPEGGLLSDSAAQNFSIQLANDGSQSLSGNFFLGARSEASLFATPALIPEVPQVPGIPEPGTYALMGLGLGLMAWRVRGHRA